MIKAGFSQTVITPPVGAEMPGSMNKRFAQNIHDQLYAKAMVLDDGNTQIALVGVDALSVKRSTVLAARKQIDAETDMPGENVMVAASHTHNGGPTADCFLSESDPSYCTFVAQQIATAVIDAHRKKQEVRLIIGAGHEDSVAFNRRFKMKDGTERTHPGKLNPDIVELAGPIDPMVGVIGAVDENCKLLGCWVNYTCHCTLGVGGAGFSADYPYYLTKVIQRAMNAEDAVVVFGNGACGDVTQVDNQRDRGREFGEEWGWHVGATIGAEALKVLARLEYTDDVKLASDKQILKLSLRDIPEEEFQKA
ncbi:MAG: hypothetical protein H8D67_00305, partial [Deltaproteobacteria bacterium]|nr:hypothetical protein [Deltaproteobacteria bacterium]